MPQIMGLVGNIFSGIEQQKQLSFLTNQEKQNARLSPEQLSGMVKSATQPLNAGLVEGVTNNVTGTLAEQGLSQAPGIEGATLAQALAPFEQQNQNTALQLVMEKLGLPLQYATGVASLIPGQTNNSEGLAPLLALLNGGSSGGSGSGLFT